MAAQPFQYQIPADIITTLGSTTYIQNTTQIEDLCHALREVQARITAYNTANPTLPQI